MMREVNLVSRKRIKKIVPNASKKRGCGSQLNYTISYNIRMFRTSTSAC